MYPSGLESKYESESESSNVNKPLDATPHLIPVRS